MTDYSYTITPLLAPFNEYFFVKTDNPDPTSFRFSDKSSKYDEDDTDAYIDAIETRYADINYENSETGRVNGGYIFSGTYTDGGEVVLQSKTAGYYYWDSTWDDTNLKYTLPALKDDTDYLIDTYANKSKFFDNMDAVQSGFSNICLYSGSYIRGEIYKAGEYWSLSNSPHVDQTFYLQSPYSRKDNQSLFVSAIYPFRYDSLGFPGMMGSVAKRLNSNSSYEWDSYNHYLINVTYGGETRSYGGQGNGKGQGIDKSDIKQFFTFGTNGTKITLDSARKLLTDYSNIKVTDDVPKKDALTWKSVYDTVGSGSWVRLTNIGSIFGATGDGYTYLYRNGDGSYFYSEPSSSSGGEIYWGGDIGYASDAWVDGRYVNSREIVVVGEKFEDHPTSDIILKDITVPQIKYSYKYEYNSTSGEYERKYTIKSITETKKTVVFAYNSTEKVWKPTNKIFDDDSANIYTLSDLVDRRVLEEKYLDMVTLTLDEVKTLKVDKNTNTLPGDYYIYDGTCKPGSKNN
ncbi:MAG: hypothetical protein K2J80_04440 [Oscillospiraceae bacterium]|nr:hypothetical protein [Oscillospiraceae bacterium]